MTRGETGSGWMFPDSLSLVLR